MSVRITVGNERVFTMAECAKRTGYSVRTLYRLADAGDFPPPRARIGNVKLFAVCDLRFFKRMRSKRKATK